MTVLVIYLFSIFVFGILADWSKDKRIKNIYLVAVFLFAFLYSAFRASSVGIDTESYRTIFNNINMNGLSELPRNTEMEKGFMLLCYLLGRIISNPQIIIIVMSAVTSYAFYFIIKKYSKSYMISSLIFASMIFMATMNISRQFFALSFVLFAISFALDKKPIKTILMIIIGASMHNSALIFLPLILLSFPRINLKSKSTIIICTMSALAIPAYVALISFVTSVFPQYARFLSSARYSSRTEISIMFVLFLIFILILNVWSNKKKSKEVGEVDDTKKILAGKNLYYLFTILLVNYIVIYVISTKMLIVNRLICYFQVSLLIVVPGIINNLMQERNKDLLSIIVAILCCGYFLKYGYNYYISDPHGILPYSLILDED